MRRQSFYDFPPGGEHLERSTRVVSLPSSFHRLFHFSAGVLHSVPSSHSGYEPRKESM